MGWRLAKFPRRPSFPVALGFLPLIGLLILAAVASCLLFAGGIITGIALCIWASKTRVHEPMQ